MLDRNGQSVSFHARTAIRACRIRTQMLLRECQRPYEYHSRLLRLIEKPARQGGLFLFHGIGLGRHIAAFLSGSGMPIRDSLRDAISPCRWIARSWPLWSKAGWWRQQGLRNSFKHETYASERCTG
ncbi:MAG: hypothetical protein M3Y22_07825, partial [Pseudomonadota bacterium]|nr:hypothetical protein [Pseudomonadota bacterium]